MSGNRKLRPLDSGISIITGHGISHGNNGVGVAKNPRAAARYHNRKIYLVYNGRPLRLNIYLAELKKSSVKLTDTLWGYQKSEDNIRTR